MRRNRKILSDPLVWMTSKASHFAIFKSSPFTDSIVTNPLKGVNLKGMWSTHVVSLLDAARTVYRSSLFDEIKRLYGFYYPELDKFFKISLFKDKLVSMSRDLGFTPDVHPRWENSTAWDDRPLGKLSLKKEAAGKVRVFAMVDPITQWLFAPLHKFLFLILRGIPMDGTFNQLKPVYRLLRLPGIRSYFSLDLSAATDRLPISIQVGILNNLFKDFIPNFGDSWAKILVQRDYRLKSEEFDIPLTRYRYSVGQPMGALSSWAMLAYTHHFIIQVAAWEVGYRHDRLFTKYAVLGDDVVIADWKVARRYLKLLEDIGVECGLHKSILSHKGIGIEFAKSTFIDGTNVSPISLKELQVSLQDLTAWTAFAKKFGLSWDRQCRILGHGFRARQKSFSKLNHALQLVYLTNIVKASFNTEVLSLRKGSPKDFNTIYLEIFTKDVLVPMQHRLATLSRDFINFKNKTQHLLREKWDNKFPSDYWDLRSYWDEVIYASLPINTLKGVDKFGKDALRLFIAKVNDIPKWEKVPRLYWRDYSHPTFDEALNMFLKGQEWLAKVSIDSFKVDLPNKSDKRLEGKLPYQVRFFRAWSRISHKVIKQYRNNKTT
uniref:RNA-dependent RNA polymerase n=1 Tax=Grapevine-associated mitovirus 4 TaxID=2814317 RepID=A0A8F5MLC6_9VIRU|nr:MAG: RNA-dependent RNA polymerase [Grapevine-associated mitovirus 4]